MVIMSVMIIFCLLIFRIHVFHTMPVTDQVNENKEVLLYRNRSDWSAESPNDKIDDLTILPPNIVIIGHTATTNCTTDCREMVKKLQKIAKDRHFSDISYNFLIGGDCYVYEGRGWGVQAAHTRHYNHKSLGIAFIGNFENSLPVQCQLDAAKLLIAEGVKLKKINKNYELLAQCQIRETVSPGKIANLVKTWSNWKATETTYCSI